MVNQIRWLAIVDDPRTYNNAAEQLIPADPRQRVFHAQVAWLRLGCPFRAGFGRPN